MDGPRWFHRWMYRNSGVTWLRWATLWFSGIRTVGMTPVDKVRTSSPERLAKQIEQVRRMGEMDGRRK
jgi:hypothetical protein